MSAFTCTEARRCLEARAVGDLSQHEHAALDVHLAVCQDCRLQEQLWGTLQETLQDTPLDPLPPMVERRMLSGVAPADSTAGRGASMGRWRLAGALAAAAILIFALGLGFHLVRETPSAGTADQVVVDSVTETPAVVVPTVYVKEPSVASEALEKPDGMDEESAIDHASQGSTTLQTNLRRDSTGHEASMAPMDSSIPDLSMDGLEAPLALVDEPEQISEQEAIESLTRQAQTHQMARQFEDACRIYEQLITAYPESSAARDSHVALGQMKLAGLKQYESALDHFDTYLARSPSSYLAEEARVGRVRALARLDRDEEVVTAATEFMNTHPGWSAYPEVLRLRGDAYLHTGALLLAATDYNAVIERWPNTAQAQWAANGLVACQP